MALTPLQGLLHDVGTELDEVSIHALGTETISFDYRLLSITFKVLVFFLPYYFIAHEALQQRQSFVSFNFIDTFS